MAGEQGRLYFLLGQPAKRVMFSLLHTFSPTPRDFKSSTMTYVFSLSWCQAAAVPLHKLSSWLHVLYLLALFYYTPYFQLQNYKHLIKKKKKKPLPAMNMSQTVMSCYQILN